ncbi:subtilase family protein [Lacrimispora xylanisolvens]|uniref:Subtilase family protein n=1 Tax=Lacrimispora xylanisolvens TaxID=384636 RepID=A0A2S6HTV5_9FIRM|nr:S8 family peptidase [Hungatella xylanolytica]PPK81226.1 subtilase family protein [Hungatella xylanolytica]
MQKILDENYYDFIIDNSMIPRYSTGDNITLLNDAHSLLHVSRSVMDVCDIGRTPYYAFPSVYTLASSASDENSPNKTVEQNTNYNLLGQCTLVGIVDTGIDYQHPAFRNADGSTRIVSLWDQTDQSGASPKDFTFGTEYTKQQINAALLSNNTMSLVPTVDTIGHGTAIASIISGSIDTKNSFRGIVPYSELVVVKLKEAKKNLRNVFLIPEDELCFQESDVILGIRYLVEEAKKMERPLVICIAMGTSQGIHDGQGVMSQYLANLLLLSGVNVSIAAGDEGNRGRHYFGSIDSAPYSTEFQLNISNEDKKLSMEIWPSIPGRPAIQIISPDRLITYKIEPSFNECIKFAFDQGLVWVNNIIFEEETGQQLILIRFDQAEPGLWTFRLDSTEIQPFYFNSWLPSGNLISDDTYFINASSDTTIINPGNSINTLTTSAYNQLDGTILVQSSRGYTSNGMVKPDIAAPGYQIPCALPQNRYGTMSGTGAAAAQAAGGIAMVMEWTLCKGNFTSLTGKQINRMIARGAKRSSSYLYPNNVWGYGQLDINGLITRLINVL